MLSSTSSGLVETSLRQPSDSRFINNETHKIHRVRKKSGRRNNGSRSKGPGRIDSERTRRRSVSLLEIKNLEFDCSDTLRKTNDTKSLTEEYDKTVSSARRKRRDKHRQKVDVNGKGTANVITTVIGNLIEEETHSSNKTQGEEDMLVGDWEYTFAPPKPRNVSCKQYVEQKSNKKFFPRHLVDFDGDECYHAPGRSYSPITVAICVQKYFRPIASLFCGLLGGICLWQCCMMMFWTPLNQESFMKYFSDGAQSFQCFFYFLATISLVSVLDSYDFSQSTNKNFWYALPTTSSPLIISVVLMSSVVLSLICAPLDDKLAAMAVKNNWTSENNITLSWVDWDLEWWATFNYVRCTGAVLTWILFCVGLGPDALWNQLFDLLNLSKNNEEEISGST